MSRENGKRRVVARANVRGRDIGGYAPKRIARSRAAWRSPPGCWITRGGRFENLIAARIRLPVVVPLATVVIGGVLSSTFLTLIVLPVLYRLVHREREVEPAL